jgi:hypothetical protein
MRSHRDWHSTQRVAAGWYLRRAAGIFLAQPSADAIRALAYPLQGVLHLLTVLVEEMDQDVAGLPVGEGLRQVGLFWDASDQSADRLVQRPVEARFLATRQGEVLQVPPVGFEPLFGRRVWTFTSRHWQPLLLPEIPRQATLWFVKHNAHPWPCSRVAHN